MKKTAHGKHVSELQCQGSKRDSPLLYRRFVEFTYSQIPSTTFLITTRNTPRELNIEAKSRQGSAGPIHCTAWLYLRGLEHSLGLFMERGI